MVNEMDKHYGFGISWKETSKTMFKLKSVSKPFVRFGQFGLLINSEFAILQDVYPVDLIHKVSVHLHLERSSLFFIHRTASKYKFFWMRPIP